MINFPDFHALHEHAFTWVHDHYEILYDRFLSNPFSHESNLPAGHPRAFDHVITPDDATGTLGPSPQLLVWLQEARMTFKEMFFNDLGNRVADDLVGPE